MNTNSPKNDSFNSANSPTLNEKLTNSWIDDLDWKLEFLRELWLSEENIDLFRWVSWLVYNGIDDILNVLWEKPNTEEVAYVDWQLELVTLQLSEFHTTRIRWVVMKAANDGEFRKRA